MKFLTVAQVHRIIELAELLQADEQLTSTSSFELVDVYSAFQNLITTLRQRQTVGTPEYILSNYVYQLDDEEVKEAIALMLLGRGDAGEKIENFSDLVQEVSNLPRSYLLGKSLLAKYLRNGLAKLHSQSIEKTENN